jgi:hypothetical protein
MKGRAPHSFCGPSELTKSLTPPMMSSSPIDILSPDGQTNSGQKKERQDDALPFDPAAN